MTRIAPPEVDPGGAARGPGPPGRFFADGVTAASVRLGLMLLAADAVFCGLHLVHLAGRLGPRFSVEADGGYPEAFQYVKEFWAAALLLAAAATAVRPGGRPAGLPRRGGAAWCAAWAGVFGLLLADDALSLHEAADRRLADLLGLRPAFGLRAGDFAELLFAAAAGTAALTVAWAAALAAGPRGRRLSGRLLALLGALALFGVGLDVLHSAARPWPAAFALLGLAEDGGEMAVVSLTVAFLFGLTGPHAAAPPDPRRP